MPAPSAANSLSLGRPVIDPTTIDTIEDVRENFAKIQEHFVGAGFPCGAQDGDTEYLAVYAQPDGDEYILWGGNPTDPLNPTLLTLSLAGSATVIWQDEGVTQVTTGLVDFQGAGVTVTDGGSKAIVTIPGGSGTPYTEGNGIDINGSNVVSAELATGGGLEFDGSGIAVSVDGVTIDVVAGDLEVIAFNFGTIAVSGQSNVVADAVSDTLTLVAGSNVTITTNAGSDSITIASTDTNTTYTAGAGINLSSTKFVADPHTASHVGLVDPTTGDDSSADDAQIGILWHNIEGVGDGGRNQLFGHVADDSTKPKVTAKETEGWLELLESYDSTKHQVIINDPAQTGNEGSENVRWGDSPQKTLWCIDPDGGHTITTTGTTLTLTLKITKYTFDAVNFTSATDADVTVTYTGTAC